MDIIIIFEEYLEEKNSNEKIHYIIITSGTSGKDVIKLHKKYFCVKEVIIFSIIMKNISIILKIFLFMLVGFLLE